MRYVRTSHISLLETEGTKRRDEICFGSNAYIANVRFGFKNRLKMYTPNKHRWENVSQNMRTCDRTKNVHTSIELVLYRGYMEDSCTLAHIS